MYYLLVKVWGKHACFTRPDSKVEVISYAMMTPSAAIGILRAIYWNFAIQWKIKEIRVLKPIRFKNYSTNIVNGLINPKKSFLIIENDRIQRNSLILCDVEYIIVAKIISTDGNLFYHRDKFRDRVNLGLSYSDVYLGCREFQAFIGSPNKEDSPIQENINLGNILKYIDYTTNPISFHFMPAFLHNGVLRVD